MSTIATPTDAGRRKTVETVTTWSSMPSQILALLEHLIDVAGAEFEKGIPSNDPTRARNLELISKAHDTTTHRS